jgi:hypothetical protein
MEIFECGPAFVRLRRGILRIAIGRLHMVAVRKDRDANGGVEPPRPGL